MSNPQHAAPLVFTPSERVLLFGDRFAKPAGMLGYGEVVLTSGTKVSADDLAVHAIAAAYLACEQAGAVRLEIRQGKAMFRVPSASRSSASSRRACSRTGRSTPPRRPCSGV